jgi:hypothetical protein
MLRQAGDQWPVDKGLQVRCQRIGGVLGIDFMAADVQRE